MKENSYSYKFIVSLYIWLKSLCNILVMGKEWSHCEVSPIPSLLGNSVVNSERKRLYLTSVTSVPYIL